MLRKIVIAMVGYYIFTAPVVAFNYIERKSVDSYQYLLERLNDNGIDIAEELIE